MSSVPVPNEIGLSFIFVNPLGGGGHHEDRSLLPSIWDISYPSFPHDNQNVAVVLYINIGILYNFTSYVYIIFHLDLRNRKQRTQNAYF